MIQPDFVVYCRLSRWYWYRNAAVAKDYFLHIDVSFFFSFTDILLWNIVMYAWCIHPICIAHLGAIFVHLKEFVLHILGICYFGACI